MEMESKLLAMKIFKTMDGIIQEHHHGIIQEHEPRIRVPNWAMANVMIR